MIELELAQVPNQSFSTRLGDNQYDISILETNGCMSVSISRNNVKLLSNVRAVGGTPLIPYRYLEDGNFAFITQDEEYPYYDKFGITQSLIFVTQAELSELRAGT